MRLLIRNNIPADIRCLIEAKVRLAGELPLKFIAYMSGCGKGNYARKRRARKIPVVCHKCARMRWLTMDFSQKGGLERLKRVKDDLSIVF